jgi:hypothetical protein
MRQCIIIILFFLVFINCNNKDEFIYSNIDGLNHKEILGGPENIEKHSLELIYQIDTTLSMEYFNILLLKLNEGKDIWRPYYFNALSLYCNRISLDDKSKLEASIFNYFLHHPKEYLENIEKMNYDNSDCLLVSISSYIKDYLNQNEITIVSMKNVAHQYCMECSDQEITLIYDYLDLALRFQKE